MMSNPADIVPFAKTMGIVITTMDKDVVRGEMLVRPEICTAGNGRGSPSIHGGAVMTFADVLGAFGGFANLPEGSNGTTTSESKTNFLNAAPEGSIVYGEATPFKTGRRQSVWQTKITLEDGTLVAVRAEPVEAPARSPASFDRLRTNGIRIGVDLRRAKAVRAQFIRSFPSGLFLR